MTNHHNHHKNYKNRTNHHPSLKKHAAPRDKRVRYARATLLGRQVNTIQMSPVRQGCLQELQPIVSPLLSSRSSKEERIARIILLCVLTLGLSASLLFLSATPYNDRSSIDDLFTLIHHLSRLHLVMKGTGLSIL
jgi:hypothetical protein